MSLDLHPVESPDEEINKKNQASKDYANSSKKGNRLLDESTGRCFAYGNLRGGLRPHLVPESAERHRRPALLEAMI